ncbi:MAG TPA: hypothetical protein VKB51_08460 [bacterium]|nr:hypothetical protein [bacterium]
MTTRARHRAPLHGPLRAAASAPVPRPVPTLPGRAGTALAGRLLLSALLVLALAACSTARRRDAPQGPFTLLHYRDAATADYFRDTYRSGNFYEDFRPALVVDAIVQDRTYRRLYVDMLRKQFLLSDADVKQLQAQQEQAFETEISILLFTYEGTNEPSQLDKANAPWRLFLRDDEGQLESPLRIQRIRPESRTFLYINKYFRGLDRWSQAYQVDFPKLSKGRLGVSVGSHPFELIITGVPGTVTLKWDNPRVFYAVKGPTGE